MELIEREWLGMRFSVPQSWSAFLVEAGAFAFGPAGETFVLSRGAEPVRAVADRWLQHLQRRSGSVLSERWARGPRPGLLRVTVLHGVDPRIVTQLFIGGTDTVTASHAACARGSYDRDQADAVVRSICLEQPTPV